MSSQPVFVHVGLPKTGTTDLQKVMWGNRRRLADMAVAYPGKARGEHYHAALDLLGRWPSAPGAWDELTAKARSAPGRVVLSHEMLAMATPAQVARVLEDLAPREVHMVISVRDFSRIVSATWQERAKNRKVEPWRPFLNQVAAGPAGKHSFWRLQDAPQVIDIWRAHLPGDRIHVITVPPLQHDPRLLLRRFAQVVGFSPEDLVLSERPANQSIGALEIAVLQHVNLAAGELCWEEYVHLVKNHLVKNVLAERPDQVRVVLPEEARPWVQAETARIEEAVASAGCHLVGDLADLEPKGIGAKNDRETDAPEAVPTEKVLAATSEAVVELVREVGRLRRKPKLTQPQAVAAAQIDEGFARRLRHFGDRVRQRAKGEV